MYTYETTFGTFEIAKQESGRWDLRIDGEVLKSFENADQAADAVYYRKTGHADWDSATVGLKPAALRDWHKV